MIELLELFLIDADLSVEQVSRFHWIAHIFEESEFSLILFWLSSLAISVNPSDSRLDLPQNLLFHFRINVSFILTIFFDIGSQFIQVRFEVVPASLDIENDGVILEQLVFQVFELLPDVRRQGMSLSIIIQSWSGLFLLLPDFIFLLRDFLLVLFTGHSLVFLGRRLLISLTFCFGCFLLGCSRDIFLDWDLLFFFPFFDYFDSF